MAENGRLPKSSLRPIAGGGWLEPRAAAAWNAMAAHIFKETGQRISPAGSDSSYRPIDRQWYFWNLYQSGQGNLAAYPGTSNHGWGLAVDASTSSIPLIAKYGAPFGWQKQWSDAPSEPWHFKYATGHYGGPDPGPKYKDKVTEKLKRKIAGARKAIGDKLKRIAGIKKAIGKLRKRIADWAKRIKSR